MKISIITLFPEMVSGFFKESILRRAIDKKFVKVEFVNLRDFAQDRYKTVDDKPYGGGAGMILKVDILKQAIDSVVKKDKKLKRKTILTSPQGVKYTQKKAEQYSRLEHIVIVTGHYEGHDERISDYVDEEVSLGDFVLTGGEIVATAIADSIVRLIPGVLKKPEAVQKESFSEVSISDLVEVVGKNKVLERLVKDRVKKVKLLEYPQYTRPFEFIKVKVPQILIEGNHEKIRRWRLKKSFEFTLKRRPDLLS